jgi:hypothetical protein
MNEKEQEARESAPQRRKPLIIATGKHELPLCPHCGERHETRCFPAGDA